MTNLEDLPKEVLEDSAEDLADSKDNLLDSGIEKDLEQMITSDPESRQDQDSTEGSTPSSPPALAATEEPLEFTAAVIFMDEETEGPTEVLQESSIEEPIELFESEIEAVEEPVVEEVECKEGENEYVISSECDDIVVTEPAMNEPAVVVADSTPVVVVAVDDVIENQIEVSEPLPEVKEPELFTVPAKANKKRKNKNRTEKKVMITDPVAPLDTLTTVPLAQNGMSYSAVCRARNILPASQPVQPAAVVEPVPEPEPVKAVIVPTTVAAPAVEEWETVPSSLTNTSNTWERKEKKRRRNKKRGEVVFNDTPEVYPFQTSREEEDLQQENLPDLEQVEETKVPSQTPEVTSTKLPSPPTTKLASPPPQEEDVVEGGEERRKVKKKKKRGGSEEPDESSSKRVLICDSQVMVYITHLGSN